MTTNLNAVPIEYDHSRTRFLPEHTFDCGHCQTPIEAFHTGMVKPGNFHHPGMSALLCERCTKLFWEAEFRNEAAAEAAGY